MRERDRERQTDRHTERQRQRQRHRDTDRDGDRDRQRQTKNKTKTQKTQLICSHETTIYTFVSVHGPVLVNWCIGGLWPHLLNIILIKENT